MGRIIQQLIYRLRADNTQLKKDLAEGEKQTKGFSVKSLAALGALAVGAVAAFKRISAAVSQSIKDYGRQIDAEQSLEAAVRASGQSVRDVVPVYKALASEIQELTTVGDEAALEMISLATSMGVTEDQMEDTIKGAIGLSDAFGIGTQQAIRGVALAMDGNFTALSRYIPALRTANTDAEKMEVLQQAMANGFDVSTAKADSAYGALQQYQNAVGDVREQLGQTIAEGIEPFVRVLTGFALRVAEASSKAREFREVIEALRDGEDVGDLFGIDQLQASLKTAKKELEDFIMFSGGVERADATETGRVLRENLETLKEQVQQIGLRALAERDMWAEGDNAGIEALKYQRQFSELVARRIGFQQEEREALAEIERQLRLNFITEEDADQARRSFYRDARQRAIEVADAFDDLAETVRDSGLDIELHKLGNITNTALGDQIQRVIAGFTAALGGVGDEAEDVGDKITETADNILVVNERNIARLQQQNLDRIQNLEIARHKEIQLAKETGQDIWLINQYYDNLLEELERDRKDREDKDAKDRIDKAIQTTTTIAGQTLSTFVSLFAALDALQRAQAQSRIDDINRTLAVSLEAHRIETESQLAAIDEQLQTRLESEGLLEETRLERLQREREAAIAEGDTEEADRLDKIINRTILEAEYADIRAAKELELANEKKRLEDEATAERAEIEYKAALESWRLQRLSTIASAAQAVINAFSSMAAINVLLASAAAAAAAAVGVAQVKAVTAAKPVRAPTFAGGGAFTVPPGFPNDSFALPSAFVQSGERVSVETAEQQALNRSGGRPMRIMISLDGRTIAASTAEYINDGVVRLEAVR